MRIHYDTCSNIVSRVAFENFYRISSPTKSNDHFHTSFSSFHTALTRFHTALRMAKANSTATGLIIPAAMESYRPPGSYFPYGTGKPATSSAASFFTRA